MHQIVMQPFLVTGNITSQPTQGWQAVSMSSLCILSCLLRLMNKVFQIFSLGERSFADFEDEMVEGDAWWWTMYCKYSSVEPFLDGKDQYS